MGSYASRGGGGNSTTQITNRLKWHYPEFVKSVDKLEKEVEKRTSFTALSKVITAIKDEDNRISAELQRIAQGIEKEGDETVLMAQRRRIRKLATKAFNKAYGSEFSDRNIPF